MKNEDIRQDDLEGMIFPWEWAKDKIYPCLAPRRWKNIKTQHIVYKDFIDLSIYYYIRFENMGDIISVWIDKKMMEDWGIRLDTLDAQAMENLKKDGYTVEDGDDPENPQLQIFKIYLVANGMPYGAAGFLDKDILSRVAVEEEADLYILPSGVHEVMLLVTGELQDTRAEKSLNKMIRDMNQAFVKPEERLADHAYHYERKTGRIRIV